MLRCLKTTILASGALLLLSADAGAQSAPPGAAAPIQVGVVILHAAAVKITSDLPGRVSASASADVRPQVEGIIKTINFKAGQQVKAGDVLYELDDAAYAAQVSVQSAAVQKAEAALSSAQAKVTRYQQLAASNNVSQSDLLDAQASLEQAKADVASAQASLGAAQINERLTKVAAPISGVISDTSVPEGGLVTAAQTAALATVRQLDPSYVDLVETSSNLLKVRSEFESGSLQGTRDTGQTATVRLTLEDGTIYADAGEVSFPDVVVSESTGTFTIRATFPNARRVLLPGMFVRATVELGTDPKAFLVPQRAVTFNASGNATALFVENGKAVTHELSTNGNSGNSWIVTGGIADGAQVVVDGLQKVSNGSSVNPVTVTLDANGVVVEPTTGGAAAAATATPAVSK